MAPAGPDSRRSFGRGGDRPSSAPGTPGQSPVSRRLLHRRAGFTAVKEKTSPRAMGLSGPKGLFGPGVPSQPRCFSRL